MNTERHNEGTAASAPCLLRGVPPRPQAGALGAHALSAFTLATTIYDITGLSM